MTTATKERKKRAGGVSIERTTLMNALSAVAPATKGGRNKPILGNVLFHDGWLTATDETLRIDCRIAWDVEPILLPHARLLAILREVKDDEVEFIHDGTACVVKVSRGEWRLPLSVADEFPLWEPAGLKTMPLIPEDQFWRAVGSVISATDDDSSRYALGGVRFEVSRKDEKCWFVATDGRRLSCAVINLPMGRDVDDAKPIVPENVMIAMRSIAGLYGADGKGIDFEASESEIVATFSEHRVSGRLIVGEFPKWRSVFPAHRKTESHEIRHDELARATRAAAIVQTESSKGVRFVFEGGKLTLTAQSSDFGKSEVEIEVDDFGTPGNVKLDPRFVQEVLRTLPTQNGEPSVRVSIDGPGDAVVITYGENGEYRSVIMPLSE